MRFNELDIEKAVLETETVKSFKIITEKQQLNEVAPLVYAGAMWALSLAASYGITWITEETVNLLVNNWRESGWTPNPSFVPEGTRVVIEDSDSGQRINFRFQNGQWEGQALVRNAQGEITGVSQRFIPLTSEQMSPILEKAANQRRGWVSRLFRGRNSFNGLGYDFRNVTREAWERSVALAGMTSRRGLNSEAVASLQDEYDRLRRDDPQAVARARQSVLRRSQAGFWPGVFVNLGAGLAGIWYLVNEINETYKQEVEAGTITTEVYFEKLERLKNTLKTLIGGTVFALSGAAIATMITSVIFSRFEMLKRLRGWPARLTAIALTGTITAAIVNERAKQILVDFLADTYLIPEDSIIDQYLSNIIDDLLEALGIRDIVQDAVQDYEQDVTDFEPSTPSEPTSQRDPNRWFTD